MASSNEKTTLAVGLGAALLGGLALAFGGAKKKPAGAPLSGAPKKSCNCSGR